MKSDGYLQVTKRVDTDEKEWNGWNWRTEGDIMVNGAFFVPSGEGLEEQYAKASSVDPKSAGLIDQLTMNAGVLGGARYPSLSQVFIIISCFLKFSQLFISLLLY